SRRRHTRFSRDWSSDVCSSDLGVAFATVINGLQKACDDAKAKLDISSHLIMCFLRHLSEDAAFATLEQALPYKDQIIAVGLDSRSEERRVGKERLTSR